MRQSLLPALLLTCAACAPGYPHDDALTMAHAQVKGTHNSYHLPPIGFSFDPWRATMAPLDVQLDAQGVRALELDLHLLPGVNALQVFHVAEWDEETTCRVFTDCLRTIERWSAAHPGHLPLALQLEVKEGYDPVDAEAYFALVEAEILSVFARERIITPDEVKGAHPDLRTAVAAGWPTLSTTRGRVYFFFDNGEAVVKPYTRDGRGLEGRLAFVNSTPDDTYAAVAILNNPFTQADEIARALAAGMIVRTRADSDSEEPLKYDDRRMLAAVASGAQIVSTDYPVMDELEYELVLPGGQPARCSPVVAPAVCTPEALEHSDLLVTENG